MKKILILLGVLLLLFGGFVIYDLYFSKGKGIPVLNIEEEKVDIEKIYVYGTHLNMEGHYNFTDSAELVLYNGEFIPYSITSLEDGNFSLSEFINDGIYLDKIATGDYYLFLRTKYMEEEEEKYKYYALNNTSSYKETTYYTMSNYNKKIVINNEESYPTMMMHVTDNTEEVYDIVIDPGHGGMDGGASKNGYKETDFTMDIATKLKSKLEEYGFKVKLTYEKGQLSKNEKLPEYGTHGRAVVPREVNAKYLFSVHLNSSESASVSGLEVYTAKNINYDFAKLLVNNITTISGLGYSNNRINRVSDSIYSRNFTQANIDSSMEEYQEKNMKPYDITTNSNYYYIIRETGGIVTGAYVDNRNSKIVGNPYVLSNVGTESYLLELGYLSNKNNLNNVINNMDKYVEGIATGIKTLYDTES